MTLLHLPYTAWHLSYVAIGCALAPVLYVDRLLAALLAFFLALGVAAHALDELRGRPLQTEIPGGVLLGLAAVSLAGAVAIGIVAAVAWTPWLLVCIAVGAFLVPAYNLELFGGTFHSDLWFGIAWGAFPLLTGYLVTAERTSLAAVLAALWALCLSLGQRHLSTQVRTLRRRVETCPARSSTRTAASLRSRRTRSCARPSWPCERSRSRRLRWRPPCSRRTPEYHPAAMELAIAGALLAAAIVFAIVGWIMLRKGTERARDVDRSLAEARAQLDELVAHEVEQRAAELDGLLSRARADSLSAYAEEERRIASERRSLVVERERDAGAKLADALATVQRQVEQRIRDWRNDLDRTQASLSEQVARLGERQRELVTKLEARLAAESQRLAAAADEQKAEISRLRTEFEQAVAASVASVSGELDAHAAERRRALREVGEQLAKREHGFSERIVREESEAAGRIKASFADIERRQVAKLERVVERASERFGEAANVQFDSTIKAAREDAARRLGRELDRAVQQFTREAENVLGEQLAHAGNAGASRLEKKLARITAALERQRDEFLAALERRLLDVEQDVKQRLEQLSAEGEAEREVLEGRLAEVSRRLENTAAALEDRLTRR